MLVKYWMSKEVISLSATDTMKKAFDILEENNIRNLPVLDEGQIVGIVTDRDLKKALIPESASMEVHEMAYLNTNTRIGEIMTKDVITVSPDLTIDEVARILMKNKISGVPVVNEKDELCGMITQGDIFKVLIALTGTDKSGFQLAIQIKDYSGSIKEIADIIRSFNCRITSLLTSYDNVPEGYRNIYFVVTELEKDRISELKKVIGEKGTFRYCIDYKTNDRQIMV